VSAADESAATAAARARLAALVPAHVREVCGKLTAAGYQTVTVGGAVRDALLDRDPGDWDVATSAPPEAVIALFRRTVPTGLQHGTVTVMMGRDAIEVTTFRGEGAYTAARRPDHVVFGVPLDEDLARRDLVVNAMAYDPASGALHDPFGGVADLAARRLRAVGEARARFAEDGLRVMRAVRFAATLEFELDAATEAAIAPTLPSLARVSRERVCVELRKLLAASAPSRGLRIAARTGLLAAILPAVVEGLAGWGRTAADLGARVDGAPTEARLGALLADLATVGGEGRRLDATAAGRADEVLRGLTFSNAERQLATKLVGVAGAATSSPTDAPGRRRLLADVGRPTAPAAIGLWRAMGANDLAAGAAAILTAGDALAVGELAIGGKDLITTVGIAPGPRVGATLAALLDAVLDVPALNTREQLLARAQRA
jgi:tRNA nucleotidyltransferase (CCA-adding enzyme)